MKKKIIISKIRIIIIAIIIFCFLNIINLVLIGPPDLPSTWKTTWKDITGNTINEVKGFIDNPTEKLSDCWLQFKEYFKPYDSLEPSLKHRKLLGIEIIKLPSEDIQKLHSLIKKEYEKMLPPEAKIIEMKFSQPRTYRDLEGKIGIVVDCKALNFDKRNNYIFIFKKVDNKWEIAKAREVETKLINEEWVLIQDLLHSEQLGIEEIKLPIEEEQKLHSMIKKVYEEKLPSKVEHLEIWFWPPRRYKELNNRMGIISFFAHIYPPPDTPEWYQKFRWHGKHIVFIFKKVDNEWEIEKIGDKGCPHGCLYEREKNLIQEIIQEIKKGGSEK